MIIADYLQEWKNFTMNCLMSPTLNDVGLLLCTAFSCAEIKCNLIE